MSDDYAPFAPELGGVFVRDQYCQEYFDGKQARGVLTLSNRALADFILKACEARDSLLEIGCAKGAFLRVLEPQFRRSVGLDISGYAIAEARRRLESAEVYQCNAETDDLNELLGTARFDTIVSLHTFEHFEQPETVLRSCFDLLKRDGTFFLVVPNPNVLWARIYRLVGLQHTCAVFADPTHRSLLTRRGWERLLSEVGFAWTLYGRPIWVVKNRLLHGLYPAYYTRRCAESGFELLFVCNKPTVG